MVPVWSMTRRRVISGLEGSRRINFSATTTWAELDTGRSSARPCTTARITTCQRDMGKTLPRDSARKERIEGRIRGGGGGWAVVEFEERLESELNTEVTEEA